MMKKLLPILIFLISINYSRQDQTIKTTSDSFGIWKISYYVDEFGDRTDQGYIKNLKEINGTFSNSATTDSYLQVDFLIEFDKVSIKLFEYSRDHPVKGADINHSYSLSIKHNGKRINKKFSSRNYSDRAVFDKEESLQLIDLFKKGGKFQFYMEEVLPLSAKYNFEINISSGFMNAWEKLYGQLENKIEQASNIRQIIIEQVRTDADEISALDKLRQERLFDNLKNKLPTYCEIRPPIHEVPLLWSRHSYQFTKVYKIDFDFSDIFFFYDKWDGDKPNIIFTRYDIRVKKNESELPIIIEYKDIKSVEMKGSYTFGFKFIVNGKSLVRFFNTSKAESVAILDFVNGMNSIYTK